MKAKLSDSSCESSKLSKVISVLIAFVMLIVPLFSVNVSKVQAATLLQANFNSDTDGFAYQDDPFGTSQPNYASGSRVTGASCYGGSGGCLSVTLGGVDGNDILGMSGGWKYDLTLSNAESGVVLSFRYKLDQTAKYEYDEYSRIQVTVDGVLYGRGTKSYVDHLGGDGDSDSGSGGSSAGNSNTFLPTTDWQRHEIYLGELTAGTHTIILGAYNNKKTDSNESTTGAIDDVMVSNGNAAPGITDAQTLVNRVDINQFLAYNQGVAQFDDRCRGSGLGCSSSDYSTNYFNALTWVEQTLQALGYTTVRQNFNYSGNAGTNLYATKVGTTDPTSMYMLSAHLDGRGGGDAFDDDGSGVALVMEVARVLAGADVTTDKSVRFLFWDKEELGLYGSRGYVQDRRLLQGTMDEPTWLGLITHDMILYDHGAGTAGTEQSVYADLDVEWRSGTAQAAASRELAMKWRYLAGTYMSDYPANAYDYSTNTDDTSFHPYVASISVRENRRSITSGTNAEWVNPYYHKTTDLETSYMRDDDGDGKRDDIELGYNAVQATLGLVAELAGAHIVSPNQPPVANGQAVEVDEDGSVAITLSGTDPEGQVLSYSVVTNPGHGTLTGSGAMLSYTPAPDYHGTDSFSFKVNDGVHDSAPAVVAITVNPVNDAPTAHDQNLSTVVDTELSITLSGSDLDGDALTYEIVSQPSFGTIAGVSPVFTYIPNAGFIGSDSFYFSAFDGQAHSNPAAIAITVRPVNHAPTAIAQAIVTDEDTSTSLVLNGTDPDGDTLSFSIVANPIYGSLSGSGANWVYTPNLNYAGSDSFTFLVNDGQSSSDPAVVSVTVNPVNDPPTAISQSLTTNKNLALSVVLSGTDVDNQNLSFMVVTQPTHGSLSGTAPNLVYTPQTDYVGTDIFAFVANDGVENSQAATVSITVKQTTPVTIFSDNFETNLGWTRNPSGTDTASSGGWERANPQSTSYSGPKQLGTTVSGLYDLVTGPLAGSSYSRYDVDGGVTTIRSPLITLPASGDLEITFAYYMAHRNNSSSADYFRVKIVGNTTVTILQELGAANDDDAAWATFTGSLNNFRGQAIYILIEAADMGSESLVEAAVDNVLIVQK